MSTPTIRELMTSKEVATAFRVTPKTVALWGQAGKLSSIRTPTGPYRFFADEVHALLAATTTEATR
ncbi:MerR family DNA-binding transcriptional regulator [Actinomadura sediminis]|uniref:MerR family DNA-binding transcriptional regulator n=1 Tax=Actinomadura sediminis TaxID=1038904 RepID=A0ABW3ESG0_9ACTN